jgi:phosphotransferase system  glucose/maltose/N-acetylglucosamine-specific IIC component
MNPKEFFKRWSDGMKNLTVEQQLKGMIAGAYGNIIGFSGGIVTMGYFVVVSKQYQWWWSILILIIALYTTVLDLFAKKKQLESISSDSLEDSMRILEQQKVKP